MKNKAKISHSLRQGGYLAGVIAGVLAVVVLVTFEESDYNQDDATGFINLWGLPDTVQAMREQGKLK